MQRFAVIMAGGSGERFWPASRRARPKQLLRLTDAHRSMVEEAIARIAPLVPPERVLIATSEILAAPIAEALPELPRENVLAEPEKRNTAACLALAAAHVVHRCGDPAGCSMAVLTADHQIGAPERFRATVDAALAFAERDDALVTIGVVPTRAETGYGYVEVAAAADARAALAAQPHGAEPGRAPTAAPAVAAELSVLPVARFREKPDLATARDYVGSGRHLWNSGMFFWRVSTFLDGLRRHMPELAAAADAMRATLGTPNARERLREVFLPLADVSIDVGLMERASNVHVIRAAFAWDDVGAWDALARTRPADAAGNVAEGDPILIDSRDCVVYNEPGGERMAVAVIGLDGVIVATTPDGVVVCPRDRAQDVKRAVAELRARGRERFT